MAVDLGDLVDSLKREVNPPGVEMFPDATDDDYLGNLRDSFWEARLDGMLAAYEEADGEITPVDVVNGVDMPRDLQQLIVFYAGIRIVRNDLRNMNTTFRTKAGPVEFETGKSAQVLRELLLELKWRRNLILTRLADIGAVADYYIDAVLGRDLAMDSGNLTWVM